MSVRTVCLAALTFGERSGYEIRKLAEEGAFSHFIDASFGAIYPALARLADEGLVVAREEQTPGKPTRKVYSITPAGRAALAEDLSSPCGPDIFRSRFCVVAMCAPSLPRAVVVKAINERLAWMKAERDQIIETIPHTEGGVGWVHRYGLDYFTSSITWLEAHRAELEAIAGSALAETGEISS